MHELIKKIKQNLLPFFIGAFAGFVLFNIYLFKLWIPANAGRIGLGIIAIIPIMFIILSLIGIILGGVLGLIGYYLLIILRKKVI